MHFGNVSSNNRNDIVDNYLSLVAIFISVFGLLFQYFGIISDIKERITRLETKTELFWKCVETGVVGMLKTYPTNVNKDVLLDNMLHNELTLDDAQELRSILKGEMELAKKENILIYVLALGRIEQVIFELTPRKER